MPLFRALRRILVAIFLVGGWVGTLYLAKDIEDAGEALRAWRDFVPIDRETALIWFSGFLLLWVLWIDLRPLLLPHLMRHLPFLFKLEGRISLVEFGEMAKRHGWAFSNESLEAIDLLDGLRQAAIDGEITLEGRLIQDSLSLISGGYYPLCPISPETLKRDHIVVPMNFVGSKNEDTAVHGSWKLEGGTPYDIHISDAEAARSWLRREGPKWRGREEQADRERKARRAEYLASQAQQDTEAETQP